MRILISPDHRERESVSVPTNWDTVISAHNILASSSHQDPMHISSHLSPAQYWWKCDPQWRLQKILIIGPNKGSVPRRDELHSLFYSEHQMPEDTTQWAGGGGEGGTPVTRAGYELQFNVGMRRTFYTRVARAVQDMQPARADTAHPISGWSKARELIITPGGR